MKGMYNKLPHSVSLNGEKFIINTDYRIFIDFENDMQEIDQFKAINKVLNRFYPAFSLIVNKNLLEEAIDKFIWFYQCGKEKVKTTTKYSKSKNERVYDYSYDDLYIWGAFKMYFHIDLSQINLHWWKFKAMYLSIPQEAEYSKIKGYRAYTGKDKNILELKEHYKLPKTGKEKIDELRRDKIYERLKEGG